MPTPRFVRAILPALLLALSACSTLPGTGGDDPCLGKDPAREARADQGNPTYPGQDVFTNQPVQKGTVLYSLTPGAAPGFAVDNYTLTEIQGSVTAYYTLLQVTQNPGTDAAGKPRTLRTNVRTFEVNTALCAGFGKALANPQHGPGGGTQYFISPSDAGKLSPGVIRPI